MLKKVLPFAIAALMIPGVALAKGPNPNKGTDANHGKAKVMYVLRGMIYAYMAYNSTTSAPGSITIDVKHSNRHGKLLVDQTITLTVGANTKVLLANGVAAIAASKPGDLGMVKVRASRLAFKGATLADVQNTLLNHSAFQVIDWGRPARASPAGDKTAAARAAAPPTVARERPPTRRPLCSSLPPRSGSGMTLERAGVST